MSLVNAGRHRPPEAVGDAAAVEVAAAAAAVHLGLPWMMTSTTKSKIPEAIASSMLKWMLLLLLDGMLRLQLPQAF